MSLLDARFPELDLFLQRWRRRLNRVVVLHEALRALAVAAPVAALTAVVATRGVAPRWGLWLAVTGLLVAAWVLLRWRRRLTAAQAAAWLDERAGTEGLFGAAASCLGQDETTGPQREVLVRAEGRRQGLRGSAAPSVPGRRLWTIAVVALALAGASTSVLGFDLPRLRNAAAVAEAPESASDHPLSPKDEDGRRELSPREAAQRLFPEDERLAALAEQALASGDPGALQALLEQNAGARNGGQGAGAGRAPEASSADETNSQPSSDESGGERTDRGPGGSSSAGDTASKGSEASPVPAGEAKAKGQGQQPDQNAAGDSSTGGSSGAEGSQGRKNQGNESTLGFGKGGAPGIGHSQQPLGRSARPGTGGSSLPLKEPGAMGLFEYVLPGSEAQRPTADTVASSARSAEALLSRTSPPLEFENTIRDYFLSLSQEATP